MQKVMNHCDDEVELRVKAYLDDQVAAWRNEYREMVYTMVKYPDFAKL